MVFRCNSDWFSVRLFGSVFLSSSYHFAGNLVGGCLCAGPPLYYSWPLGPQSDSMPSLRRGASAWFWANFPGWCAMVLFPWKSWVCSVIILCVRITPWYFCPKRLHCLMHSGTVLHLGLYHVLSCFRLSFSFRSRNFLVVMNLDGCDRLFSLHLFRTFPVG